VIGVIGDYLGDHAGAKRRAAEKRKKKLAPVDLERVVEIPETKTTRPIAQSWVVDTASPYPPVTF
jgi:ribosomal protein L11